MEKHSVKPRGRTGLLVLLALLILGVVHGHTGGNHSSGTNRVKGVPHRRRTGHPLIPGHRPDHPSIRELKNSYTCMGCLKGKTVRVLYMDGNPLAVDNKPARAKAAELNMPYECNDPVSSLPECFDYRNWDSGWLGELAFKIFTDLGAEIVTMTQANFSQASYEVYTGVSAYTRCVWDLKLGNVDICVGDFWETNDRRSLTPFTSLMELDAMTLVTMPTAEAMETGFKASELLSIFAPFTPGVWVISFGMWFFATLTIYLVEFNQGNEDYKEEDEMDAGMSRHVLGLLKTLWLVLMGYFSCSVVNTSTRWPGRLVVLGYGFFVYITVSSYAANMVNFMLRKESSIGQVTSIDHLKSRAGKMCVLESMMGSMSDVPTHSLVPMDDYGPTIEALYRGKCQAAVISQEGLRRYILAEAESFQVCTDLGDRGLTNCQSENGTTVMINLNCSCPEDPLKDPYKCPADCPYHHRYCTVLSVFDPEFRLVMGFALPVSPQMQDYMSAWLVEYRLNGLVESLRKQYVNDPHPPVCEDRLEADAPSSNKLGVNQMAGNYLISSSVMFIGLAIHLIQSSLRSKTSDEMHLEDEDADPAQNGDKGHTNGSGITRGHSGHEVHLHSWQSRPHRRNSELLVGGLEGVKEKLQAMSSRISALETPGAEISTKPSAIQIKNGESRAREKKEQLKNDERALAKAASKYLANAPNRVASLKGEVARGESPSAIEMSTRSPRAQGRSSEPLAGRDEGLQNQNGGQGHDSDPGPRLLGLPVPAPVSNIWNALYCKVTGKDEAAAGDMEERR